MTSCKRSQRERQKRRRRLSYARAKRRVEVIKLLEAAGGRVIDIGAAQIPDQIGPIDILPGTLQHPRVRLTDEARSNRMSGVIRYRVLVGTDGSVRKEKIIKGMPYGLNEMLILALKDAKFSPGMHEGKPVEYWICTQCEFTFN